MNSSRRMSAAVLGARLPAITLVSIAAICTAIPQKKLIFAVVVKSNLSFVAVVQYCYCCMFVLSLQVDCMSE